MDACYVKEFNSWINLLLDWSRKEDHAGLKVKVSLLWISFAFEIYDRRHWNYEANCWQEDAKYEQSHINYEWF